MKVLLVGDLHNQFNDLNELINKKLLQLGDMGVWERWENGQKLSDIKPQGSIIYFIAGNHEDYQSLPIIRGREGIELVPNVIYMPRGSTLKLDDGRNILFMGGARSIDKSVRREGWDWFAEETIGYADMQNLPDEKVDILITHTCPEELVDELIKYYPEKRGEPSNIAISQLLKMYKPSLHCFAHWHHYKEGTLNETKWYTLSYPRHGARWWMWLPEKKEEE
jgi:Icc-related predicted phosphoesterase